MVFEDRILVNPRLLRLKNPQTNEVIDWEIQDLEPEEVVQEGTEINAQVMNEIQTTVVDGLNSTSTTDALSANQGKVLNGNIQTLMPTVLYRNSTGVNGTVTLSDRADNYEQLVILFRVGSTQKSVTWRKHSTRPFAQLDFVDFSEDKLKFYTKTVQINGGTTITNYAYKKYTIQDSETWTPYGSDDNEIYIIAVLGYKY